MFNPAAPGSISGGRRSPQPLPTVRPLRITTACVIGVLGVTTACDDASTPFTPAPSTTTEAATYISANYDKPAIHPSMVVTATATNGPSMSLGAAPSFSLGADAPSLSLADAPTALPVWESTLGTSLDFEDDDCRYVPLGFTFSLYGKAYAGAYVASNGNVTLNYCNTAYEGSIPQDSAAIVAPATGDWSPVGGEPGNVYYAVVGDAPNRRFVVTWSAVHRYEGSRTNTFQLQLIEGSNSVQFGYKQMAEVLTSMRAGISSGRGQSMTVAQGAALLALQGQARCLAPTSSGTYTLTNQSCALRAPNKAPAATVGGTFAGVEGQVIPFEGGGSDPDGDVLNYAWDFGDGSPVASGAKVSHVYTDNGSYKATLTVTDATGLSSSAHVQVAIANVAPSGTPSAPATVGEGTPIVLAVTNPQDPSSTDRAAGLEYAFDCGNGYGEFRTENTASCPTYDNGVRRVAAKIRDKDGDATEYAAQVVINNVAPRVSSLATATIYSGETYQATQSFTDPGVLDAMWTYVLSWGDSRGPGGSTADQSPIAVAERFFRAGSYSVSLEVTDKDGDTGRGTAYITVLRLPVPVDVRPSAIKLSEQGEAKLPVAILSTATVDVSTVELGTVRLGRSPAVKAAREDLNGDGRTDVLLHFERATLVRNGDVTASTTSLTLTADLADRRQIIGSDAVRVAQ